jgi:hypothetical protein
MLLSGSYYVNAALSVVREHSLSSQEKELAGARGTETLANVAARYHGSKVKAK